MRFARSHASSSPPADDFARPVWEAGHRAGAPVHRVAAIAGSSPIGGLGTMAAVDIGIVPGAVGERKLPSMMVPDPTRARSSDANEASPIAPPGWRMLTA